VAIFNKQQCGDPAAAGQSFDVSSMEACAARMYADPSVAGAQLGPLTFHQPPCTPDGMPTRAAAKFKNPVHFCVALRRGTGCAANQVCVPRPPAGQPAICALLDGRQMCPTGTVRAGGDLFASFTDDRKCGACTCSDPKGGSCAGMQVQIGNAGLCDSPGAVLLTPGAPRTCAGSGGPGPGGLLVTPGMRMIGTPTQATCLEHADLVGTPVLTEPKTVCCTN
jgi:hypothetical protein